MQTEKLTLAIYSHEDRFAPCIQYMFDLFGRTYGHTCHYLADGDPPAGSNVVIRYTDDPLKLHQASKLPHVTIARRTFFGDAFGKSAAGPDDFRELVTVAKGTAFADLLQRTGNDVIIPRDMLAAAFYLLSGYHDWMSDERDNHGRTLSTHVGLPLETWDTPVVNHWLRQLNQLVLSLHRGETELPIARPAPPAQQTICLTHDVDLLRKYRPGSTFRRIARTAVSKPSDLGNEISQARRILFGASRDPYDSFDQLYAVKERVSAPSTYFFLGSAPGGKNGDYRIADREPRNLMTRARTFGDEIAVHGSWESRDDAGRIQTEKAAVEAANRNPAQGWRQHYLRFSTPQTWRHLAASGVRYDSTGGFPDRCGFKYGWSGCFQPFDLDNMQPLPIIEIPLVCMDVTLAAYEKIPAELALERLSKLLDSACDHVPGGAFVFLWHNIMGDKKAYPGYWDTFEYFFSVASGAARYITLSQLCDEYEAGLQ